MSGPSTAAGANSASRFVSGGTIDKPIERDDEWLQAQIEIDERSRARAEKATTMMTSGRTLFEQLQENKNKKLLEHEERKEYRPLDEAEIEYLKSLDESTHQKETMLKRETAEKLMNFRHMQRQIERRYASDAATTLPPLSDAAETATSDAPNAESAVTDEQTWKIGPKKRKSDDKNRRLGGLVKKSRQAEKKDEKSSEEGDGGSEETSIDQSRQSKSPAKPGAAGLGLGLYPDSDSDGW